MTNDTADELELQCRRCRDALQVLAPGSAAASQLSAALEIAHRARSAARADLAIGILEQLTRLAPTDARAAQLLGFALGDEQRIPDAASVFSRAAELDPADPLTAFAHAQASLDAGLPAEALFAHAGALAPANLDCIYGSAAALEAQGESARAEALLEQSLRQHPDWLKGHRKLAALRWTSGDTRHFARSYESACAAQLRNLPLRLAWFGALAQAHDWEAARRVLSEAEAQFGDVLPLAAARAFMAGETGDTAAADEEFARVDPTHDPGLGIACIRHHLRTGRPAQAERIALALLKGRSATMIWPYLSLIWRLRGDARAHWLDGEPPYARAFDLSFSAGELETLARVLRPLHRIRSPYIEQSVRGGTQTDTDRQLFFRAEPEIQAVRAKVSVAIREYIEGMVGMEPGHPLLGVPRGRFRFSGSWSVRLASQGHNVSHTHPMGWISSALYVSLPSPAQLGPAPAGWFRYGVPPPALGLDLPPYGQFEPRPGRLVLFPSTMWHDTVPFDEGERLVIAFDVIPAPHR